MSDILAECCAVWPWATWHKLDRPLVTGAACAVGGSVVWVHSYKHGDGAVSIQGHHVATVTAVGGADVAEVLRELVLVVTDKRDRAAGFVDAVQGGGP